MKLYNHMMSRGGEVEIQALEKREVNVTSVEEVFETALAYEQHITERINNLYEMAAQKNDYPLQTDRRPIFLH